MSVTGTVFDPEDRVVPRASGSVGTAGGAGVGRVRGRRGSGSEGGSGDRVGDGSGGMRRSDGAGFVGGVTGERDRFRFHCGSCLTRRGNDTYSGSLPRWTTSSRPTSHASRRRRSPSVDTWRRSPGSGRRGADGSPVTGSLG